MSKIRCTQIVPYFFEIQIVWARQLSITVTTYAKIFLSNSKNLHSSYHKFIWGFWMNSNETNALHRCCQKFGSFVILLLMLRKFRRRRHVVRWRHQNKKNLQLETSLKLRFFYVKSLWNNIWYILLVLIQFGKVWIAFTQHFTSFKIENYLSSNGASYFEAYVYLFGVTWLLTWASVISEDISE